MCYLLLHFFFFCSVLNHKSCPLPTSGKTRYNHPLYLFSSSPAFTQTTQTVSSPSLTNIRSSSDGGVSSCGFKDTLPRRIMAGARKTSSEFHLFLFFFFSCSGSFLCVQVFCMSWSPDGKFLATVCKDGKVRTYDPRESAEPVQVCAAAPPQWDCSNVLWKLCCSSRRVQVLTATEELVWFGSVRAGTCWCRDSTGNQKVD